MLRVVAVVGFILVFSRHHPTDHLRFSREIDDVGNYIGTTTTALCSVLSGLTAVASWTNFSSISGLVFKEAATVGVIYLAIICVCLLRLIESVVHRVGRPSSFVKERSQNS